MSQEKQIDVRSHEFLRKLYSFISDYEGQLPNLRDIFRTKAIDWLIAKSMKDTYENQRDEPNPIVDFVINSGYKDKPKVGKDRKPLSRHSTPVHLVSKNDWMYVIPAFLPDLFKIYDRFDVNYTDENGFTHFHAACTLGCTDVVEKFLDLGQDPNCPAPEMGDSPLHLAVINDRVDVFKLLLRRGANPNWPNENGLTPLHCIIAFQSGNKHDFLHTFFKINKKVGRLIEVDARDKKGRTPLELALILMLPRHQVSTLVDNGADLSSFIFPSKSDFVGELKNCKYDLNSILGLLSGAMAIVEQLEKRGYELKRSDALTIMALFKEYKLFKKSKDKVKHWPDKKLFAIEAKKVLIKPSLSLYDLIRLKPNKAAKILTCMDYYDLAESNKLWKLSVTESTADACIRCLCEKLSRGVFRRWALDSFLELTGSQLPILCCEKIIDKLKNRDLYNVCLAAASHNL